MLHIYLVGRHSCLLGIHRKMGKREVSDCKGKSHVRITELTTWRSIQVSFILRHKTLV